MLIMLGFIVLPVALHPRHPVGTRCGWTRRDVVMVGNYTRRDLIDDALGFATGAGVARAVIRGGEMLERAERANRLRGQFRLLDALNATGVVEEDDYMG